MIPKSPAAIVRVALMDWAKAIVRDVLPQVEVVAQAEGEVRPIPVAGIEWGTNEVADQRPTPIESYADGRARWRIANDEVPIAFTYRCDSFEHAELVAYEFRARAQTRAARVSKAASRTIKIAFKVDGRDLEGRLYLEGKVDPYPADRAQKRNEWIARIPALVVFPVVWVDPPDDPTGQIKQIEVEINGSTYPVPLGG